MKSMRGILNGVVFGAIVAAVTSCSSTEPKAVKVSSDQGVTEPADAKYPEFSWDHVPRYMHLYKLTAFTEEELEYLAKFPLITFEKAQGVRDEPSVQEGTRKAAAAVKAVNPQVKVLYYKNVIIDWYSAMSPELETIEGGYLRDTEGNYPVVNTNSNRKYFDISQPAVQDWWMKDATQMLSDPHIDGIFIDANIKVWVTRFFAKWNKLGDEKARQIQEGYHQLMTRLNDEHRKDKIILANILRARFKNGGLEFIDYFDGSYLEAFEHGVDGVSRPDYMAKGIACAQEAARDGKIIALTVGMGESMDTDNSGIGADEARRNIDTLEQIQERLDYLTAVFLVIAEKYSYFYPHDRYVVRTDGEGRQVNRLWMKDLPVFTKKLGHPKGPASKDGYIYTREFEHCSVWLDIENETARLDWR